MPGGKYDSSKTRVGPVFDKLRVEKDWIRRLLALPRGGCGSGPGATENLEFERGYGTSRNVTDKWSSKEMGLNPPVALLSWLVRNGKSLRVQKEKSAETESQPTKELRKKLRDGDPKTVGEALWLLRSEGAQSAWYVFEGPTYPDVYLETPDALIVVEGKRTEATSTTYTTWLEGRHQIWRHIDAAWEIRGRRKVYGFFIVEGDSSDGGYEPPAVWAAASEACLKPEILQSSFPHRSGEETEKIAKCFLGVTTWQKVCATFGIEFPAG